MSLAFFNLGPFEIALILIAGLLLFGRRLPEVGRNLGKGIVEFKKGMSGIEEEIHKSGTTPPAASTPTNSDPKQLASPSADVDAELEATKAKLRELEARKANPGA